MLLGASLFGNLLTGKGIIRSGEGTICAGQDFKCRLILQQTLKYKSITENNINLMVFIQEIVYT